MRKGSRYRRKQKDGLIGKILKGSMMFVVPLVLIVAVGSWVVTGLTEKLPAAWKNYIDQKINPYGSNTFFSEVGWICAKYESNTDPALADLKNGGFGLYQMDITSADLPAFIDECLDKYDRDPYHYQAYRAFEPFRQENSQEYWTAQWNDSYMHKDQYTDRVTELAEAWRQISTEGKNGAGEDFLPSFTEDQSRMMIEVYYNRLARSSRKGDAADALQTLYGLDLEHLDLVFGDRADGNLNAVRAAVFSLSVRRGYQLYPDEPSALKRIFEGPGGTVDAARQTPGQVLEIMYANARYVYPEDSRWVREYEDVKAYYAGKIRAPRYVGDYDLASDGIEKIDSSVGKDYYDSYPDLSDTRKALVDLALSYQGKLTYEMGGASLTGECDCSGFTMLIYQEFGIRLPHYSVDQLNCGTRVQYEELLPGDLVVYGENRNGVNHVAIYIGKGYVCSMGRTPGPEILPYNYRKSEILGYTNVVTGDGSH